MNNINDVIDLTESFYLSKAPYVTNEIIELLDTTTDDSCNDSFVTVIEHNTEQVKVLSKKKCDHQFKQLDGSGSSYQETQKGKSRKSGWGDCPICWDKLGRNPLASTKCGHVYCLKCLEHSLNIEKRCPTCRRVLKGASAYHPLYINI